MQRDIWYAMSTAKCQNKMNPGSDSTSGCSVAQEYTSSTVPAKNDSGISTDVNTCRGCRGMKVSYARHDMGVRGMQTERRLPRVLGCASICE